MRKASGVRFGVIGAGYRFPVSMLAHRPQQGLKLTAAADPDPKARHKFLDAIGGDAKAFASAEEMISSVDLDAVFVLSPDWLHKEHTCLALEAGCDVFVEKPMAITAADCDSMLETARRTGRKLFVGHNMRLMSFVRSMKEIIDRGEIGKVKAVLVRNYISRGGECYFQNWHAESRYSGSLLIHKGCHDIDAIHWLAGANTKCVQAVGDLTVYGAGSTLQGRNENADVEDLSLLHMCLDNGVLASYEECHFAPDYWRNYSIIGDRGRLENFGDREGCIIRVWNKQESYRVEGDQEYSLPPDSGQSDRDMIDAFIATILENASPLISPVAGRNAVAAAEAATNSLREKGTLIPVKALSEEMTNFFK